MQGSDHFFEIIKFITFKFARAAARALTTRVIEALDPKNIKFGIVVKLPESTIPTLIPTFY